MRTTAIAISSIIAILVLGLSAATSAVAGQLDAASLAQGFSAPDLQTRDRTVSEAASAVAAGSGRQLFSDDQVLAAVLSLLRQEDEEVYGVHSLNLGTPDQKDDGEGYAEYYGRVHLLAVAAFPFIPPPQQQEWLTEFAASVFNTNSQFAEWLAGFGDLVVDPLVRLTSSKRGNGIVRQNAYAVLAEMVGLSAFRPQTPQPYPHPLSFTNRQRALKAVDDGLKDSDEIVQHETVRALRRVPSTETLSILQRFARSSRGEPKYTSRRSELPTLQEEVEKAINGIQSALTQTPK